MAGRKLKPTNIALFGQLEEFNIGQTKCSSVTYRRAN